MTDNTTDRIVINNPGHGTAIARNAGVVFVPGVSQVVARTVQNKLLGGVIFDNYTRASITVHMAGFSERWANRDLIWCVFDYAFNQLGVKKVFGQVPASNERALEIDRKLGFVEEHRVKDVFPDGDLVVMAMYKDQCRWINRRPRSLDWTRSEADGGQELGARAAGLFGARRGVA